MKVLKASAALLALLILYLCFWPVPIDPQSWDAPVDVGYVGDFAPNEKLANLDRLDIGDIHGPEDVAARMIDGALMLFVSSQDGVIRTIDLESGTYETFAQTGGVPLGLEFDSANNLIIADAFKGLLSAAPDGTVTVLTNSAAGTPILYADDLDIGPGGIIYFSDASTKFGAEAAGSTMAGSLLEIMEHGSTGRILAYDPADQTTRIIKTGISFANGVAMSPDGQSILVIETGKYRILRIWVNGPRDGETDIVMDNLPGFPDNINPGPDGTYFVGLISKRSEILDDLSSAPFWRKMVWRLPAFMKPSAQNYGFIIQMDDKGNVLQTWQDPSGAYPQATGAIAPGDGWMYVTSLNAEYLGRRPFP